MSFQMSFGSILAMIIILLGIYGLTKSRHIIKSIILLNVAQTGIVMFFISLASKGGKSPIHPGKIESMVDPLPQALMITTIVIGAAITALALMMSIKIFHYYGTLKWKKLLERKG